MASMTLTITLIDRVTKPAMEMIDSVTRLVRETEQAGRRLQNALDIPAFDFIAREAQSAAQQVEQSMDDMVSSVQNGVNQINQAAASSSSSSSSSSPSVFQKLLGFLSSDEVQQVVDLSDQVSRSNARLDLLAESPEDRGDMQSKILGAANRSKTSYLDTANTVTDLGLLAGDTFSDPGETIAFTELMNKNFALGGMSTDVQKNAMDDLTQAMAGGGLQEGDLYAILEAAPLLSDQIEDYMVNVENAKGSLQDWASEGLLTAGVVKNAVLGSAEDIENRFSNMPTTWEQLSTVAQNVGLQVLQPILGIVSGIANNMDILLPLVLGLAGAFFVFQLASNWTKALELCTRGAAAATAIYNAVMAANPIVLVVMLIMILIGALYAGVAAYNKLTGSAVSAGGIIGAIFATLAVILFNTFIVPLQRNFAMLVNFLGNVFRDPVAAIQILFCDLATTVLGYLITMGKGVEELLNKIPGVEVDFTSNLDQLYRDIEQIAQEIKDESELKQFVDPMDYKDPIEAANAAYQEIKEREEKFKNGLFGEGGDEEKYDLGKMLEQVEQGPPEDAGYGAGGSSPLGAIKEDTGRIANSVDLSTEYLDLLKDMAEREAINQFTTVPLYLDARSTNNVSSDIDLDSMVTYINGKLWEGINTAAEGAHI